MNVRRNSEVGGLVAGLAILLVGGAMIVLPPLVGIDGMDGGFALQFGGLFVLLTGLITAVIFAYRARRLAAMFEGQRLLAHWQYDPHQVEEQARRDLAATRQRNLMLLSIMAFFFVACILLFVAIGYAEGEEDSMPLFVGMMLGILVIIAAFALGMPYIQHRRALRSSGEAIIAENGLYINGALHTWNAPLAYLDGVVLVEEGGEMRLVFSLRSRSRTGPGGYEEYSVDVPVPAGQEATARDVEQHFLQAGLAADWSV